jgi:hypothetical protein
MNAFELNQPPLALRKFQDLMGISRCTLYRYRRLGWLSVINIAGRPYITSEAASEFNRRAAAGDFKKAPHGAARRSLMRCLPITNEGEVLP